MGRVIQHIPQHQNFAYIEECCLDGDAAGVQRAFLCAAEKDDICEQCAGGVLVMGQQDDLCPGGLGGAQCLHHVAGRAGVGDEEHNVGLVHQTGSQQL